MPNDVRLGGADSDDERGRLLIVTGPNMGGKSTYLRMVALCVLLAQVGSFVPARTARIGLVDRLFTRVGSEDDLAAGASTFLVEMAETASILRQATLRSLVVLDEVGRGTSTHDGLCIAQAVLEHLHDVIGARTLFATHFHELTALADTLSSVRNVTVAVDERDGQLAFLYRVVPGAADRSYGVQVARLAGLLGDVTDRAALLLREREAEAGRWTRGRWCCSGLDRRCPAGCGGAGPVRARGAAGAEPDPSMRGGVAVESGRRPSIGPLSPTPPNPLPRREGEGEADDDIPPISAVARWQRQRQVAAVSCTGQAGPDMRIRGAQSRPPYLMREPRCASGATATITQPRHHASHGVASRAALPPPSPSQGRGVGQW